jgi:hypothetical protein
MGQNTLASDKQINYIKDLITQRPTWPTISDFNVRKIIRYVKRDEDVAMRDASKVIDALLKLSPTSPMSVQQSTNDFTTVQDVLKKLPLSRYALPRKDGTGWDFFEVTEMKATKSRFIVRLLGNPGDWNRKKLPVNLALAASQHILEDPKASAVQYATQHGRCAVCNAHLSDPVSIAASMGPICAKRFK